MDFNKVALLLAELLGLAAVVFGIAMVSVPAALIAGGLLVVAAIEARS